MDFLSLLRQERDNAKNKNEETTKKQQLQPTVAVIAGDTTSSSTTPVFCLSSSVRPPRGNHRVAEHIQYIPDFLSVSEESTLLSCIHHSTEAWQQLKTRRLQCWYNQNTSSTTFPMYLKTLINLLVNEEHIFADEETPNHVLINQYSAVQGILHHTDGPCYLDKVAILSLSSSCLMTFRSRVPGSTDEFSFVLRPRSLLVFSKQVYSDMMHGIYDGVLTEKVGGTCPCINMELAGVSEGDHIERGLRTSLTVRKKIIDNIA